MVSSTFSRTASSETPIDSSALAATPSPSWINPKRMCSVPIKLWFSSRASSCASTRTLRALSVNRSNTPPPPSAVRELPGVYRHRCSTHPHPSAAPTGTSVAYRLSKVNPVELLGLPALSEQIQLPEPLLMESVVTGDGFLDDVTTHLIAAGGNRLRPVLALATATGGSERATREDLLGAVSVELVHLASLYHDDVMDEATIRRNVESVNSRFGNLVAIVAGDFLLARSAEIAAGLGTEIAGLLAATLGELCQGQVAEVRPAFRSVAIVAGDFLLARSAEIAAGLGTEIAGLLAATLGELCQGQVAEVRTAFDVSRTQEDYTKAISGKTASLMATSCRIGALTGGLPLNQVDAFTVFGRCFGMIFQVRDDILDVIGSDAELGKPAGQDLAEGVYTLPTLLALADPVIGPELKPMLGQPLDQAERDRARSIVASSSAVPASVAVARRYAEEAANRAGRSVE